MNFIRSYLRYTSHYYYGLLLTIPVFFVYETGIWWLHNVTRFTVRNLIDVLVKWIISHIGASGFFVSTVIVFVLVLMVMRPRAEAIIFRWRYILFLLIESTFYALVFAVGMFYIDRLVLGISFEMQNYLSGIILSCGAGFYEELMFRAVLFGGVLSILHKLLSVERFISWIVAAVVSSVIFSLVHFIGIQADSFAWYPFLFRLAGGLFFCLLYSLRGFAVAVYVHTIYDILISLSIFHQQVQ